MKPPRFLFVVGVGRGAEAHPVWPDIHQPFSGEVNGDDSWVAWRLTGANHRELGRSPRVFPGLTQARENAELLRDHIVDAEAHILTVPQTTTWGWRLMLGEEPIATSSRGYARHRECTYNVSAFAAAAAIAEVSNGEPPRSWQLSAEPVPGTAL